MDEAVEGASSAVGIGSEVFEHTLDNQEAGSSSQAEYGSATAPGPVGRAPAKPRAHRVLSQVSRQLEKVIVARHEDGMKPTLEEMTGEAVASVEPLGVHTIHELNALRKIGLGRHEDEVIVVRHEAVRVRLPAKPPRHGLEESEEEPMVLVVEVGPLPPIAAGSHVVDPARDEGSQWARHA